jgi:hypothetical protein
MYVGNINFALRRFSFVRFELLPIDQQLTFLVKA